MHFSLLNLHTELEVTTLIYNAILARQRNINIRGNYSKNRKSRVKGISLLNKHIHLLDVDSAITNVTIKDAPFELSSTVILQQNGRFGEVVSGRLVRRKIRDTGIRNCTRYKNMLSCVPLLPPVPTHHKYWTVHYTHICRQ